MSLPEMVVVKEEVHRIDADNVAAFLRSRGLEATVEADDAGSEIPALDQTRFVRVLVPSGDAKKARALIEKVEGGSD